MRVVAGRQVGVHATVRVAVGLGWMKEMEMVKEPSD
jgi:hypothetical protein